MKAYQYLLCLILKDIDIFFNIFLDRVVDELNPQNQFKKEQVENILVYNVSSSICLPLMS